MKMAVSKKTSRELYKPTRAEASVYEVIADEEGRCAVLLEQMLLWWGILSLGVISIPILSVYLSHDAFARQFAQIVRGGSFLGIIVGLGTLGGMIGVGVFIRNLAGKIKKLFLVRAISVVIFLFMMSFIGHHV